jgi:TRAP-type C4-dicarboxylate transport system permease small subunit
MIIWTLWDRLLDAAAAVAVAVTAVMCVGICADVTLRNLDHDGLPWVFDFTEYGLLVVTACMAPYLSRAKRHVEVDIVLMMVGPHTARALQLLASVLTVAICITLAWYALRATAQSFGHGSMIFRYVLIPEWLPFAAVAGMFVSLAIEGLRQIHLTLRRPPAAVSAPSEKAF